MPHPADAPGSLTAPRRYRSQMREQQAEQTKRDVVRAAHDLFVAKGWAATGMREVAAAAGVASVVTSIVVAMAAVGRE